MRLLATTIDLGTALKGGGVAVAIAVPFALLKGDVVELERTKASGEAVIRIEATITADQKRRDEQHQETLQAIRELRADLKDKQDKP